MAGVGSGALTALAPLYGLSLGLDSRGVGLLMSVPPLTGLVLQWPLGRLSDRHDRRKVMLSVTGLAGVLSLLLAAGTADLVLVVFALFALQQGTAYALYPMALAHANDLLGMDADTTEVASGLLMLYGGGAAVGPLIAGAAAIAMGPAAGFVVTGAALALCSSYGLYRVIRYPAPRLAEQLEYRLVADTTPEVFELESGTVPDSVFEEEAEARSGIDSGSEEREPE